MRRIFFLMIAFLLALPTYASASNSQFNQQIKPLECYFDSVNSGPLVIQSLNPEECKKVQENINRDEQAIKETIERSSAFPAEYAKLPNISTLDRPLTTNFTDSDKSGTLIQTNLKLLFAFSSIAFIAGLVRIGWDRILFKKRRA